MTTERLDRAYVTTENDSITYKIKNLPIPETDHLSIDITIYKEEIKKGKGYWKVKTHLLQSNKEYDILINKIWTRWENKYDEAQENTSWDIHGTYMGHMSLVSISHVVQADLLRS